MAILGYNTQGIIPAPLGVGAKGIGKFTLASAGRMTELHGWVAGTGANIILCIYRDVAGTPTNLLAYTAPIALPGGNAEISQSGFSVMLAAGDYWLGWVSDAVGSSAGFLRENTGGTSLVIVSGAAFNPPADPYEGGTSGTRLYSVWAIVQDFTPTRLIPKTRRMVYVG